MILCVLAAATLFALFVRSERSAVWPLVDFALFRHRAFTASAIAVALGRGRLSAISTSPCGSLASARRMSLSRSFRARAS
jgi:hypothetical protein